MAIKITNYDEIINYISCNTHSSSIFHNKCIHNLKSIPILVVVHVIEMPTLVGLLRVLYVASLSTSHCLCMSVYVCLYRWHILSVSLNFLATSINYSEFHLIIVKMA